MIYNHLLIASRAYMTIQNTLEPSHEAYSVNMLGGTEVRLYITVSRKFQKKRGKLTRYNNILYITYLMYSNDKQCSIHTYSVINGMHIHLKPHK